MRQFTPEQKIEQARIFVVTELHFFGSIFLRLNVVEDTTCRTAWTDGVSLGYNPTWLGQWPVRGIVGVIVHEIYHVILKHHLREKFNTAFSDHFKKWNRACDLALNPMIKEAKQYDLLDGMLYEDKWKDTLAEHIFDQLPDEPPCPDCNDTGTDGNGQPCPCKDWDVGEVRPFKEGKATPAEKDENANTIDQWVNAAGMKANNAGSMTQQTQELIKGITANTVNWQDELQFMCEEITRDDYTWTRPNTRYMSAGVYLPSLYGQRAVDLLFIIDTSGSLRDDQLKQIKSEVRTIISDFHIRVVVVYWDVQYRGHEIFDEYEVLDPSWNLDAKGRGGTDFTGMLDWMDESLDDLDVVPEAVICFTDLECNDYPNRCPDMPWMWAQVPDTNGRFDHNYIKYMPDWGTHVTVPIFKGA